MAGNNGKVHTESESKRSLVYVKKTSVHQTIKLRIKKFDFKGTYSSEDVSSELAPYLVWKLEIKPVEVRGQECTLAELSFKGPMANDKETLKASYHLYFVDGASGEIDSIRRRPYKTYKSTMGGRYIEHDRVRKALQADGSLVMAAEVEFFTPNEIALHGYEEQQRWAASLSGYCGDPTSSDCRIQIGGESLPAHKLLPMACSPAFHTMFTTPASEESKSGVVNITYLKNPGPVRALLRYCYSGFLDAETMDGEWSEEIFKLANKYRIADLKTLLENHYVEKKPRVKSVVPLMDTESESESCPVYVKKTVVHMTIKLRIDSGAPEEFDCEKDYSSKDVSSVLAPRVVWKLEIEPDGQNHLNAWICFGGEMADDEETLKASYHLYFVGAADGEIDSIERETHEFNYDDNLCGVSIEHDRVRKALQADGSLVVAVDIDFLAPDESALLGYESQQRWVAKLSGFCGDEVTSDCCIKIGGETLPAHKLPLMACSPVFHAMFTNPLAEEFQSGVIKITDSTEPAPMRALLHYCYRGYLDAETTDGEWSEEIFKLACKYSIDDLRALLERHFIDEALCVENVVDMAFFADAYFARELKAACIQLIAREGKTVFKSAEWKELMKADTKLAAEIAIAAYDAKK